MTTNGFSLFLFFSFPLANKKYTNRMSSGRPSMVMDGSPPVFEQIFRNARFAQGGDAFFEGKVTGNPRPELSWTREGQPLSSGKDKHFVVIHPDASF
jgi:hypothetical protein